mgnify:CR=1 FL=1
MVKTEDNVAIEALQRRFRARVALGLSLARAYRFVVELEPWREGQAYDRLGLDETVFSILDTPCPYIRMPVALGRNVANLVVHTDFNCLSVLQFAVEVLQVKHIIVCGHYGCGGVQAALHEQRHGLIDNWLRNIQDIAEKHEAMLQRIADDKQKLATLCELNVIEQTINVAQTTIVQDAWARGQSLHVHGWIYGLHDGLLRDLQITVDSRDALGPVYRQAIAAYG